jgi:hypothetical protein
MTDEDLIEHSGLQDRFLEDAYTKSSLEWDRWKLFLPYVASLIVFELLLGAAAMNGSTPPP